MTKRKLKFEFIIVMFLTMLLVPVIGIRGSSQYFIDKVDTIERNISGTLFFSIKSKDLSNGSYVWCIYLD